MVGAVVDADVAGSVADVDGVVGFGSAVVVESPATHSAVHDVEITMHATLLVVVADISTAALGVAAAASGSTKIQLQAREVGAPIALPWLALVLHLEPNRLLTMLLACIHASWSFFPSLQKGLPAAKIVASHLLSSLSSCSLSYLSFVWCLLAVWSCGLAALGHVSSLFGVF